MDSWYRIEVSSFDKWKPYMGAAAWSKIKSYDRAVDEIERLREYYNDSPAQFRLIHVWTDEAVLDV